MDLDLNERIGLIEKRLNTIEEDLRLFLRGTEEVKLRKNKLEAEIKELQEVKEQLDMEIINLRKKFKDAEIPITGISERKDDLLRKIEKIDENLNQMKINKLIIPFVASLVIIFVMVVLYLYLFVAVG